MKRAPKACPQAIRAASEDEADQRLPDGMLNLSISVDTVARVALHFLNEQDDEQRARRKQVPKDLWPEITAIRDAVEFVDRCVSHLSAYAAGKQRRQSDAQLLAREGHHPEGKVPFDDAVVIITSEPRIDRARKYYREYVRWECGANGQADAERHIELREANGIDARYIIAERRAYEEMLQSGNFYRRRGASKKKAK